MQLFSAVAKIFKKIYIYFFLPPKTQKNCPKKLLIIPLDQDFLVQQVFGFVELRQFFTLFCLIFEVAKLCRMNLESRTRTQEISHSKPLYFILSDPSLYLEYFLFCQICPGGNRLHNFAETCITPLLLVVNLIRSGSLMQASSSFSVCAPLIQVAVCMQQRHKALE